MFQSYYIFKLLRFFKILIFESSEFENTEHSLDCTEKVTKPELSLSLAEYISVPNQYDLGD